MRACLTLTIIVKICTRATLPRPSIIDITAALVKTVTGIIVVVRNGFNRAFVTIAARIIISVAILTPATARVTRSKLVVGVAFGTLGGAAAL